MKKILMVLTILALFLCMTQSATALPVEIANGTFDEKTDELGLKDGQWNVYESIYGWTMGDGTSGIEVQRNTVVDGHESDYYIELDSHNGENTNSSMWQDVYFGIGSYELSFWYHARTNNDDDDNGIEAFIGGESIGLISKKYDDQESTWEKTTFNFDIDVKGYYQLMFAAYGLDNSLGGFIDSVSVDTAPVPEPATMFLLGAGLIGLAGIRRKKIRKA